MAKWQREIMKLANDFCLNISKVKEIVLETDSIKVPNGIKESDYKYDKAYAKVKSIIMNM